jgi:hypothetical protein
MYGLSNIMLVTWCQHVFWQRVDSVHVNIGRHDIKEICCLIYMENTDSFFEILGATMHSSSSISDFVSLTELRNEQPSFKSDSDTTAYPIFYKFSLSSGYYYFFNTSGYNDEYSTSTSSSSFQIHLRINSPPVTLTRQLINNNL